MHNGDLKAVILIGGPHVGSRFRPLSFEVPPPLFPIAGSPMIYHHVKAACTKLSSIKEVLIVGYYQLTRELDRFIMDMQKEFQTPIRYLQEHCRLGTGGGIYHFRDQILSGNPSAFFVFNSDICCNFPIKEMYEYHRDSLQGNGHVMLGTEANESQAPNYGCIVEDPETNEVMHYVEKPETFVSSLINAGAYLFTPVIFETLSQEFRSNYEESTNGKFPELRRSISVLSVTNSYDAIDLERTVFRKLAGTGQLYLFKMTGFWSQIKTAGNAIYANRLYLKLFRDLSPELLATNGPGKPTIIGDVRIHPSATVDPTAMLGPNVYVGSGVTVGPGARVKEAIVLDRANIQDHCCVLHCIIGWECDLGPWSRVEGYPCDPNPNDPHALVSKESLFNVDGRLNPSITILGQGVVVDSELIVLNSIVLPHKSIQACYRNQIIL